MEIYSSAVASAAAEYLATLNSKAVGGMEAYGRGSRQRLMNLDVPEPAIAAMEKSKVAPVTVQWTAPRDGIVLERNAVEGLRPTRRRCWLSATMPCWTPAAGRPSSSTRGRVASSPAK